MFNSPALVACLALLLLVPNLAIAQYHQNLANGPARDQGTYQLVRQQQQQQQPGNLYQGASLSEALTNYAHQQQLQQQQQQQHQHQNQLNPKHNQLNQQQNQLNSQQQQFLNQQRVSQPQLMLSPQDLNKAILPLSSILGVMSPSSSPITTLNGANRQQLNIPIIPAPAAPHLTLNKFISHNNNNNNNINLNNNNQGNTNNNNNNLLLQNQIGTLNKNAHPYIPLNSYQQQQQPQTINFDSPTVNNRPNIISVNNQNLLQHLPMPPPRISPSQPQQQQQQQQPPPPQQQPSQQTDEQRVWNSNRMATIQNSIRANNNYNNNNKNNQQEANIPATNQQRQVYQVSNNYQQTSESSMPPTVVSNQAAQQQDNNPPPQDSPAPNNIAPNAISNNDHSVMKGNSNETLVPPDKKPENVDTVTIPQTNSSSNDINNKNDDKPEGDTLDMVSSSNNKMPIDNEFVRDGESNHGNKTLRPSTTLLESSMTSLESSTLSLATTPSMDQSSLSKLVTNAAPPPPSPGLDGVPSLSPSTTNQNEQSNVAGKDWYPLDNLNSRFGPGRSKNVTTGDVGTTLQPAPDILTVPPDYNADARNQSSYEIVVSQQMGAPSNMNQGSMLSVPLNQKDNITKNKMDTNDTIGDTQAGPHTPIVLPSKSPTLIQPTATTTIIWSSTNLPSPTPKVSLISSPTARMEAAPTHTLKPDSSAASPSVDDAPVVYGKPLSQARPSAPSNHSGHNSSSPSVGAALAPNPVTGQASIETSVPAMGKPFIMPVEMDEVRPYASSTHNSRSSPQNGHHGHGRHPLIGAPKTGGGPVMQIGSGLTVTAANNDTATSNQKPSRSNLLGGQHSEFMQHGLNSARSHTGVHVGPSIASSFQVSNSPASEEKNSGSGSGDLIGDMDTFDLNSESSNGEPSRSSHSAPTSINNNNNNNNATAVTSHTTVRRPQFRPRPPIPTRIDTCIVGDDSSCEQSHNERCIVEFGISSCHCRPGSARLQLRGPCVPSNSFGMTLKVAKLTDKKLEFNSSLRDENSTEYQYLEYETLQAIGTAFQQTNFSRMFMGAKVNNFYGIAGRIFINMTVNLESNNQTQAHQVRLHRAIQQELLRVADGKQRNLGDSNLWLETTKDAISRLDDINECAREDLNDCSRNATCSNQFGSYQCQCLPGYEDRNAGDRNKAGRHCMSCPNSFCSNRGECYIIEGQKQCKCRANFIGTRCDIDGEVMAVAVGGSLTALIIFIITFWCLYVYNQRWKQEQQKIDAMSATSGLTFSYVNSSTNNLMSAFSHHQQASDQQTMITSGSSSGGGPSARSMNLGSGSSSHQTSPSNQSFAGGIVGIAANGTVHNGAVYGGGHTMRGVNGSYTLSGHHHQGYGGGTTKSSYAAQLHNHHNITDNNHYRTLACSAGGVGPMYSMGQEPIAIQQMGRQEKSRIGGNCYYLSPEMLVNQQQQQQHHHHSQQQHQLHHHLYSSPQQRMLSNHSPTFDVNGNQYIADDHELCIDTSGGGHTKRGGAPRNQSYHHQNLIFNQQQHGSHQNQGRQGATLKSKSRSTAALNAPPDRMAYNQMPVHGGIYNETEFSSRDVYMPQYLMSE